MNVQIILNCDFQHDFGIGLIAQVTRAGGGEYKALAMTSTRSSVVEISSSARPTVSLDTPTQDSAFQQQNQI